MPSLENLGRHFKDDDFVLLGIDMAEDGDTVIRYVREQGLSYHNLIDETGAVSAQYSVRSTPMKFIIDKDGNLVGAALGYREWNSEEMKSLTRLLLIN